MSKAQQQYKEPTEVNFYAYPKLVFAWPLILMGLVFYMITGPESSPELLQTLGWVYLFGLTMVVITCGVDLERNYAAFWLVVFVAVFFMGRWLSDVQGITVLGNMYQWFAGLDVRFDRGFGLAVSVVLGIPYLVMILWSRIQHRWRVTHNEFEHFSLGRVDDSLARGAKRVRTTYPDLLELLLLGAGTLIVYSATGRTELRRINHVPLLPLLRRRIDRILSSTKVTVSTRELDDELASDDEEDQGRPEDELGGAGAGEQGAERL